MSHSRKMNLLGIMSIITLVLAGLLVVLFSYWSFYPYDPLTINKVEVLNTNSKVVQGEILILKLNYTKRNDVPGLGVRSFVDGIIYQTPSAPGMLPVGTNTVIREVLVPESLPPGEYYLHNLVLFKVNPVKTISEVWDTPKFDVLASNVHYDREQDLLLP
jgi:hypothetical protein